MSYSFVIPPNLQALWEAGELVRRGALLLNKNGGGIVAHLQETGALTAVSGMVGGPMLYVNTAASVVGGVASVTGVVQNEQIKSRISLLQATLESMQGMQLAGLVGSVASLGVSAAGTALVLQRMNKLREDVANVKEEVAAFRDEWRADDLDKLLARAQHKVERVQSAHTRKDATSLLNEADAALDETFDNMYRRAELICKQPVMSLTTFQLLLEVMAMTGGAHIKTLFLLEEPGAAKHLAQRHFQKFAALTTRMPADRIVSRLGAQPDAVRKATETAAILSEARLRIGSLPRLVDQLEKDNISTRRYITDAEAQEDSPLLILPVSKVNVE